jgi:hypothetical protein
MSLQSQIRLWMIVFSAVVALATGFKHSVDNTRPQTIGLAEYYRLTLGMKLNEAEAILGRGKEIESTNTTNTYIWVQPDKSKVLTVIFEKGKLIKKLQSNLN